MQALESHRPVSVKNKLLMAYSISSQLWHAFSISPKETEEFDSIVAIAERLNEQVAPAAEEGSQSELQTLGSIHF